MANYKNTYFFKCNKKDHDILKANLNLIVAYFLFTFCIGIFIFFTTNPFVDLMNFKLNIPSQV